MKSIYLYLAAAVVGLSVGYLAYESASIAIGAFAAAVAMNQFDTLIKVAGLKRDLEELRARTATSQKA